MVRVAAPDCSSGRGSLPHSAAGGKRLFGSAAGPSRQPPSSGPAGQARQAESSNAQPRSTETPARRKLPSSKRGPKMRYAIALAALLVGATMLTSSPAHAAVSLAAVAKGTALSTQHASVQPVYWRWHGRRYRHRRWVRHHGWRHGYWHYW
jgi:hypothetical protein